MEITQHLNFFHSEYPLVKFVDFDNQSKLFYDARANMVFIVNNNDIPVIVSYLKTGSKEKTKSDFKESQGVDVVLDTVDKLQQKGVLLPGPAEQLVSTKIEDVKSRIEYNIENIFMRKFVLETTQQCNFRCKYCPNTLEPVFRHHTKKQMSLSVAKASVDFYKRMYLNFFNKLPQEKKELLLEYEPPFIGFYGGEPSLNWKLVEETVDYFKHIGWEESGIDVSVLKFSINTNLYYLTDEMLNFIIKHKPLLFVSLDGPKQENDRNRITADGKGTFDKVYKNIMQIRDASPEYFKEKVMILCVEAYGNDRQSVHEFLDAFDCVIRYLPEAPFDCIERDPEKKIQEIDINEKENIEYTINSYKKKCSEGDPNALDEFTSLYFLDNIERTLPNQMRHLSISLTCPLCVDNIMIDTEGNMHLCHKTDGSLPLGNVCAGGYDMDKMIEAYKSFGETSNKIECRSCWAMNNCSYCAAQRLRGGKWKNPSVTECDYLRRHVEYLLKLFVSAYKLDPNILSKLMEQKKDMRKYRSVIDFNDFMRREFIKK